MKQFLLLIDGLTGAGKTTAADLLHKEFPGTALIGMDRIKWSVSGFKRDDRANRKINEVVLAMAESFLTQGYNVIVEHGFRDGWAQKYQKLGKRLKVKTVTVELQVPRDVLLKRLADRNRRPHPKGKPRVPESRILRNLRKNSQKRPAGGVPIDTHALTAKQVAAEASRLIRARGA